MEQMPGARRRTFVAGALVTALLSGSLLTAWPSAASANAMPVQRIYGNDAVGTSIAVSQAEFLVAGSANSVVLAHSDFFSDALAGGPLAARLGGPLLITPGASESSTLDPRVEAEIQRVLRVGETVYILGGNLALSPSIDTALQGLGYKTQRIAGTNEYATAVDVAATLGDPTTIFEATGTSFPDALSAVPAAIADGGAILLTNGSTQAPETAAYLEQHPGDTRYAIGGPLAAYGADPTATPVYGQDLYGTSAAVASTFFPTATVFGAATGTNFPDALSGGPFMGLAGGGPLLLVNPAGALPGAVSSYLNSTSSLTQGYLFGGPLAVGDDVLSELEGQQPPAPTGGGLTYGPGPLATYTIQTQPPAGSCHYTYVGTAPLPDPSCTPGALNPQVTQASIGTTICQGGYTASIRPPESVTEPEKIANAASYDYTGPLSTAEYDHLVPLELGGDPNDPANLWVEPNDLPAATSVTNSKDVLENRLNDLVCSGQLTLAAAQEAIATDWVSAYETYVGSLDSAPAPAPPGSSPWCLVTAVPANDGYSGDYDVSITSNQPDQLATAADSGDTWSQYTDGSGSVTIVLYNTTLGETIDVTLGAASCSTTAQL
jgi:hypothetical protein